MKTGHRATRLLSPQGACLLFAALLATTAPPPAGAEAVNAARIAADADTPFRVERVATFEYPWSIAFLPDGRMIISEKPGRLYLVQPDGTKTPIDGVPEVYYRGQNGLLDVALAPRPDRNRTLFFTYVAPEDNGGVLVLARARLIETDGHARLDGLQTVWRQTGPSRGGQPGGIITFSPEGHLFLTVGDRQEPATAQRPDLARGKILRMRQDGTPLPDNPLAGEPGIRALTWSTGHRNPYGLAFGPDGQLWEHEMGPRGGDELNRILPGKNYGWPLVSYGDQYSGVPIPRPTTRPELEPPALYWTPVIAPAGMVRYEGAAFADWAGSFLIGGLQSRGLVRVRIDDASQARQVNRWTLGQRIRDVAVAPDGIVWTIEDSARGALSRLTPLSGDSAP